jgi:plasmid maintenance system killer protein
MNTKSINLNDNWKLIYIWQKQKELDQEKDRELDGEATTDKRGSLQ